MGRYYSGDIEGKFWFGLQSSTAADRFGVSYSEPTYVNYHYDKDDLEGVELEIETILESLGHKIEVIDKFFEDNNGYDDSMLEKAGITNEELSEYADLLLGIKIKDCIKEIGYCSFEAEL